MIEPLPNRVLLFSVTVGHQPSVPVFAVETGTGEWGATLQTNAGASRGTGPDALSAVTSAYEHHLQFKVFRMEKSKKAKLELSLDDLQIEL